MPASHAEPVSSRHIGGGDKSLAPPKHDDATDILYEKQLLLQRVTVDLIRNAQSRAVLRLESEGRMALATALTDSYQSSGRGLSLRKFQQLTTSIFLTRELPSSLDLSTPLVAQKYIARPLLLDGHKFDLRLYVLVSGCDPLRIFLHKKGLVRLASERYVAPKTKNLERSMVHLTNYSINAKNPSFMENDDPEDGRHGHKRTLTSVLKYFQQDLKIDTKKLMRDIESLIVKTLISIGPSLRHVYRSCQPEDTRNDMCFEILGFDILLDQKVKPWLLEVNHAPSFATESRVDHDVKYSVLKDTFRILDLNPDNRRKYRRDLHNLQQQRALGRKKPTGASASVTVAKEEAERQAESKKEKAKMKTATVTTVVAAGSGTSTASGQVGAEGEVTESGNHNATATNTTDKKVQENQDSDAKEKDQNDLKLDGQDKAADTKDSDDINPKGQQPDANDNTETMSLNQNISTKNSGTVTVTPGASGKGKAGLNKPKPTTSTFNTTGGHWGPKKNRNDQEHSNENGNSNHGSNSNSNGNNKDLDSIENIIANHPYYNSYQLARTESERKILPLTGYKRLFPPQEHSESDESESDNNLDESLESSNKTQSKSQPLIKLARKYGKHVDVAFDIWDTLTGTTSRRKKLCDILQDWETKKQKERDQKEKEKEKERQVLLKKKNEQESTSKTSSLNLIGLSSDLDYQNQINNINNSLSSNDQNNSNSDDKYKLKAKEDALRAAMAAILGTASEIMGLGQTLSNQNSSNTVTNPTISNNNIGKAVSNGNGNTLTNSININQFSGSNTSYIPYQTPAQLLQNLSDRKQILQSAIQSVKDAHNIGSSNSESDSKTGVAGSNSNSKDILKSKDIKNNEVNSEKEQQDSNFKKDEKGTDEDSSIKSNNDTTDKTGNSAKNEESDNHKTKKDSSESKGDDSKKGADSEKLDSSKKNTMDSLSHADSEMIKYLEESLQQLQLREKQIQNLQSSMHGFNFQTQNPSTTTSSSQSTAAFGNMIMQQIQNGQTTGSLNNGLSSITTSIIHNAAVAQHQQQLTEVSNNLTQYVNHQKHQSQNSNLQNNLNQQNQNSLITLYSHQNQSQAQTQGSSSNSQSLNLSPIQTLLNNISQNTASALVSGLADSKFNGLKGISGSLIGIKSASSHYSKVNQQDSILSSEAQQQGLNINGTNNLNNGSNKDNNSTGNNINSSQNGNSNSNSNSTQNEKKQERIYTRYSHLKEGDVVSALTNLGWERAVVKSKLASGKLVIVFSDGETMSDVMPRLLDKGRNPNGNKGKREGRNSNNGRNSKSTQNDESNSSVGNNSGSNNNTSQNVVAAATATLTASGSSANNSRQNTNSNSPTKANGSTSSNLVTNSSVISPTKTNSISTLTTPIKNFKNSSNPMSMTSSAAASASIFQTVGVTTPGKHTNSIHTSGNTFSTNSNLSHTGGTIIGNSISKSNQNHQSIQNHQNQIQRGPSVIQVPASVPTSSVTPTALGQNGQSPNITPNRSTPAQAAASMLHVPNSTSFGSSTFHGGFGGTVTGPTSGGRRRGGRR